MSFPRFTVATALIALFVSACGSGYSSPSSPSATSSPSPASTPAPSPSPAPAPSPAPSSQVTIAIVGSAGSGAFTPNPASAAPGSSVVWRNNDSTLHHIVLDNGTDVGNVSPGATTRSIAVSSGTIGFHCTIHPSMVGTINGSAAITAPDPGQNY
jgi:plastocyanin